MCTNFFFLLKNQTAVHCTMGLHTCLADNCCTLYNGLTYMFSDNCSIPRSFK